MDSWQIEGLIKRAFERTKERFLGYFLTWVAGFGMGFGAVLVGGLLALIVFLVSLTNILPLTILLGIVCTVGFLVAFMYLGSWINLATVQVLISDEKTGVGETFKNVRPLVWQYLWLNLLMGLFILGIFPISIFTLFIIYILWAFWQSFVPFVFLREKQKGLSVLWTSREMFLQRAWGIFGRMLLVAGATTLISTLLSFGGRNAASAGLSIIFGMVLTPFVMSFDFEMYKNLTVPAEVKKPTVWFVLSMIGLILFAALFVFGIITSAQGIADSIQQYQNNPQELFKNLIPTPTLSPFGTQML